ncbi:530_t:CDS:2 [Funneliformis geosporum]|uniref:530_t:CDS:1 n=1 Tax=Funneliformis geosporum TaxID=1117311 RepID=A0A9W4WNH6_9GLOM|nr:530_t:CDS:2 [Funneliformis geosporum]
MQMDEDVGKVAQATPVLISKALELFMQSLIDHACQETKARNAKRMSVSHLKKTIMTTEQFDFLKDVVANIPDPVETFDGEASSSTISASIISSNMDVVDAVVSDEAEPSEPVQIKKRKGRKKNVDDEEYKTSTTTNPPRTRRSTRKRKEVNDTEEVFIKTE